MKDTCTCIKCDNENAYFNGFNFVCPDCNYEWDLDGKNLFNEDDVEDENEVYNTLKKLDKPFFKLKHGKLYTCMVEFMHGGMFVIEKASIMPLAFEKNKNCLHILLEGSKWQTNHPKAVQDFVEMDFISISNDGIGGYFEDALNSPLTCVCATSKDGLLLDYNSTFFDFNEVE